MFHSVEVAGQLVDEVGSQVVVVELQVAADEPQLAAGVEQSPGNLLQNIPELSSIFNQSVKPVGQRWRLQGGSQSVDLDSDP